MIVIPAIDLMDGKCVRLRQGRAEECTVYSSDPVAVARQWEDQGAEWIHVVDLDGAFRGQPANPSIIKRITSSVSCPVQVGGGLRTDEDIRRVLESGVKRAILGTRAATQREHIERLANEFGEALAVGIDAKSGIVQISGWTEDVALKAVDFAKECGTAGIKTLIYTDTSRDGMLHGVNTEAMKEVCFSTTATVIASGGVSSVDDVTRLRAINASNLIGVIVGKALYEGHVQLRDLIRAAKA